MDDLISYLLNYAFDRGIAYTLQSDFKPDFPSVSFTNQNKMIINTGWQNQTEVPFIIGHEIGHFANHDTGTFCYKNFNRPVEHQADQYSLELIYDYAANQFSTFNEPCVFMEQYGIPYRMFDDTVKLYERRTDLLF